MSFTYPAFLVALSAIFIPIIIHLFNFRKFKTIYFSNIRFLKEVKQETQAKSKLKHLLILASRILAISFLVFAFAQPFIPVENIKNSVGSKSVSIFIDNSFSMDAINKNGTLLDEAKKRAQEILSVYKTNDHFQLLTNDFEGRHQRFVNKEDFLELLAEIKISPSTRNLSEITSRQMDILNQSADQSKISFIISDFQKSTIDIPQIKNDTTINFNFIPLIATEKNNIYIDTCWFETPVRQFNQLEKLHVIIKNNSEKAVENNSIKLFINDIQKTPASFSIDKESEQEIILSFASKETGIQNCRIELNDYPVTFDDSFFFSYNVSKNIEVLAINKAEIATEPIESVYLNKFFKTDSVFIFKNTSENKIDYSTLSSNKLIILNELKSISSGLSQELKKFIENGGSLLIFPNSSCELISYNDFFLSVKANYFERLDTAKTKIEKINIDHTIYKDVFEKKTFSFANLDLPIINKHYVISKTTKNNEEYLLKLQNNDVFLSKYAFGKGCLYICAAPLNTDFSSFTKHALFVPTLYKIGMYSQNTHPLFYTIGVDESFEITNILTGENIYHIKQKKEAFDLIPEHKIMGAKNIISIHNQIKNAGNYTLYGDNAILSGISFNFNRKESNLSCYNSDELKNQLSISNAFNFKTIETTEKSLTQSLSELTQGKKMWKLCIILTLVCLGFEILLLRFMKG